MTAVWSSVAHRLGLADAPTRDRHVDGLVAVIQDATSGHQAVLDSDRLCRWQSALFPGGTSGLRRIAVGRYRDHSDTMQIESGHMGGGRHPLCRQRRGLESTRREMNYHNREPLIAPYLIAIMARSTGATGLLDIKPAANTCSAAPAPHPPAAHPYGA